MEYFGAQSRNLLFYYNLVLYVSIEVVFIKDGRIVTHSNVDEIREKEGKSIEAVFKDTFRLIPDKGVLEV